MYEHRKSAPLHRKDFARRIAWHLWIAVGVVAVALGIGILGYHFFGGLDWLDSLLNASMILGGMGPVDPIPSTAGKVFASFYALFSGLVFIALSGFLLAPFVHRLLHHFHWEDEA